MGAVSRLSSPNALTDSIYEAELSLWKLLHLPPIESTLTVRPREERLAGSGNGSPRRIQGRPDRRPIDLLVWQAPDTFDLAKPGKHVSILFIKGVSFADAEKLDEVPVGTMQYNKRIRAVRPSTMLAEVT